VVGERRKCAFWHQTATADSSLIDDNTKKYIECSGRAIFQSKKFFWMSQAKLQGVSFGSYCQMAKSADLI
jgi:hypothetical protein